jgi:hypothetical protein
VDFYTDNPSSTKRLEAVHQGLFERWSAVKSGAMFARSSFPFWLATGVALSLSVGCGGKQPRPVTSEPSAAPTKHKDTSDVSVSSEIGGLNEEATGKIFERAEPGFERCFKSRAKQVELLSGTVKFFVIIGMNEKAKSVTIEESDLGDRTAEKCMQQVLFGMKWPKPVGGRTAHAHYTAASFEPLDPDVREAVTIDADRVAKVRSKLKKLTAEQCQVGSPSPYQVTAYIDTDGKVITASANSSDPNGELAIDCLVDLVKDAEFPSPGSYAGKVTFTL